MSTLEKQLDGIEDLYRRLGGEAYGEGVTVTEHSLQAATLAQAQNGSEVLIGAALLHDIGHLLEEPDDEYGYHRHAQAGSTYLATLFCDELACLVGLHVSAKRYLCARESAYAQRLSVASVHSLAIQGGPMSEQEAATFEADPVHQNAVILRRCDDEAKVVGKHTPPFSHFRPLLRGLMR